MIVGTPKVIITKLLDLDQTKEYQITEYKKKRTKNQNNYYWELLNELAKKTRIPSDELHFELIKKSCPFSEFLIPDEADLRALEYYDVRRKIEKNGKLFKVVRVYVGSHLLDTVEMGLLLDNLIEECYLQNIETITPDELAKMRSLESRD